VDPAIKKVQVIIIGHTRELVNQTYYVLEKIVTFDPEYKICNLLNNEPKGAQVVVSTIGKILNYLTGHTKIDLTELRCSCLTRQTISSWMSRERKKSTNSTSC
jgi:superfamily II DNA/RNA helicase